MKVLIAVCLNFFGFSVLAQWDTSGDHIYNTNTGNVGIGTATPTAKLQVLGNITTTDHITGRQYITVSGAEGGSYRVALNAQNDGYIVGRNVTWETKFQFRTNGISFLNGGNVGIGTISPDAKLTVKGTIHSEEVKVDLSVPGPDYVFSEGYELLSLSEVASYIRQNKHLPEIPSAKMMEENGVKLGEMNMLLLKKVEELTLYVIELKQEIEVLRSEKE